MKHAMPISRSILAAVVTVFVAAAPLSAFQYPLSETASRSAYFLGQRHDETVGEFFARYSKHLTPPKSGLYVSDISFLTPYAQLVEYSGHQGMYSAQQAELDGPRKFPNVQIAVYIYFNNPGVFPIAMQASSNSTGAGLPAALAAKISLSRRWRLVQTTVNTTNAKLPMYSGGWRIDPRLRTSTT